MRGSVEELVTLKLRVMAPVGGLFLVFFLPVIFVLIISFISLSCGAYHSSRLMILTMAMSDDELHVSVRVY